MVSCRQSGGRESRIERTQAKNLSHITPLTLIHHNVLHLTMRKNSLIIVGSLVERCPSG